MKLHLVRHGETEWNKLGRFQGQQDIALNPRGVAQAKETARAMADEGVIALYSSPLQRTMQVANEISRLASVPVVPLPGVKELNLGELEGVTGVEMRTRCNFNNACRGFIARSFDTQDLQAHYSGTINMRSTGARRSWVSKARRESRRSLWRCLTR